MAVAKLPIYLVPEGFSHLSANIVEGERRGRAAIRKWRLTQNHRALFSSNYPVFSERTLGS
jgi:hypothetical protein